VSVTGDDHGPGGHRQRDDVIVAGVRGPDWGRCCRVVQKWLTPEQCNERGGVPFGDAPPDLGVREHPLHLAEEGGRNHQFEPSESPSSDHVGRSSVPGEDRGNQDVDIQDCPHGSAPDGADRVLRLEGQPEGLRFGHLGPGP